MFRTNWTNACEIFRDLSVAQGDVPVSVEGTLGAGDKPPALNINEETEEEYFLCSGGDVMDEGPDLGLIQEMLEMVREENLSEDEPPQEAVVVITKPDTTPITAPAKSTKEKQKILTKKKETKQKRRNIALESFIGIDVTPKTELKLLKPDDLITKTEVVEPDLSIVESSIEKVYDWLLSNEDTKVNKKPSVCLQPPTNMFRKKTKRKSPIESPKEYISMKTDSNPKSPNQSQLKEFVPSAYAMEYCNKSKEKAKLKQNMVEDIWTKAEKQMKILDEKRKAEAVIEAPEGHDSESAAETAVDDSETAPGTVVNDSEPAPGTAVDDSGPAPGTTVDNSEPAPGIAVDDCETAAGIAAILDSETAAATDASATTEMTATLQDSTEAATISNEQNTKSPRDPREKLELPGHRHLLTDDCIVYQAFTEFGYTEFSENMS